MLDVLRSLGFGEYEAKAYLALLAASPLSGYAAAKNSGVPRSKIYEVLDSLAARGDIVVSPGSTPLYRPLPAKEMILNRKARAEENFLLAEKTLEHFQNSLDGRENIWNITGRDAILQKIMESIPKAVQRILLEIWPEDFTELKPQLKAAAEKGVKVCIVAYGEIQAEFASVHLHDLSREITEEYGGRWVVFSADDREVVAGVLSIGENSRATWTMHPGLVMPITEVIIHDLYLMELMDAHRDILEKTFGKDLKNLRDKYTIHTDHKKHYI
jgi:sugar-specific transcriptional regulator TrmB